MDYLSMKKKLNDRTFLTKMRSCFGVSVHMMLFLWDKLERNKLIPDKAEPKHLFWAMAFLKLYAAEPSLASMFRVDEKTLRKWVWLFVDSIAALEVVSTLNT